ncbi:CehA/McbA family metallohydrolase [bacterium]|nr:CehA/McbA family metallohydrolase [candidate division CSSED10-310 bacterium]
MVSENHRVAGRENRWKYVPVVWIILLAGAVGCRDGSVSVHTGTDGEGTVDVSGGPVRIASPCTLTFTYECGPSGLEPKAGVLFIVSPYWGWSAPQVSNPGFPGYTTVDCPTRAVVTEGENRSILVQLDSGNLKSGEQIVFVYGAEPGKGGAALSDRFSESAQKFYFLTDIDGNGSFAMIESQPAVRILPGPARRLLVTCPSERGVGESCQLRIAVLDGAWNWIPDWEGIFRIKAPDIFQPAEREVTSGDLVGSVDFNAVQTGVGRFFVEAAGSAEHNISALSGWSNPVYVHSMARKSRLYWGDIHGHSVLSDGTGTPEDYYRYARLAAGLDFTSLTDHDSWGFQALGENLEFYVSEGNRFNETGRFTVLLGYEWTQWVDGHRNVIVRGDSLNIFDHNDPEFDSPRELSSAFDPLHTLIIPHHLGGGPVPFDFGMDNRKRYRLAEIASVHGISEVYGNPRMIYNARAGGFYRDALEAGFQWGAMASSDSHDGHPGLRTGGASVRGAVAVRAEELSRDRIFEALYIRRCYATTGARIYVEFQVNGFEMGSTEVPVFRHAEISAFILGEGCLERIILVKNGEEIKRFYGTERMARISWTDPAAGREGDWYYLKVQQMDGEEACTSPVWIGDLNPR